ncbi:hypothetical protein NR798_31420 [Archangium gephyra]
MSQSKTQSSEKKTVKETRKKLSTKGVQAQTGSSLKIIVKKRPFLFSS